MNKSIGIFDSGIGGLSILSSLIEKLGIQYINNGHKVAVIAYDPSSL